MAKKSKNVKSRKTVPSKERQKVLRILLVLLIVFAVIAAVFFACWGIFRVLFTENEHFVLRRIELRGLDSNRSAAMSKYLRLTPFDDNLFDIDLAQIKRKVEKISYIKSASIYRILPDTIKIKVTQRKPVAYLFKYGSKWVIDDESIVMNRKYCMDLKYPLPVIKSGNIQTVKSGEKLPGLNEAIELIKLTTYDFQDFRLSSIELEDDNKMTFMMIKNRRAYKVIALRKNLKKMLLVLHSAIMDKKGKHKSTIDLTYNNQVIFR